MLNMIKNWNGRLIINGTEYESFDSVPSDLELTGDVHITLKSTVQQTEKKTIQQSDDNREYRITVRQYMTQKSTPQFDFMAKWNNDVPMPYRTMTGRKIKETPGMVYMELHGDIWAEKITRCMCCGKILKNPVSQYFGIGPECGGHGYVNPFDDEDELKEAVKQMKEKLVNVKWTGWVIKKAITEEVAL